MAKGYTVAINSDTKAFKQGIKSGVIDPLEDAEDALKDLGKSRGLDQLERGMKDAQKQTDNVKDDLDDIRDNLRKAGSAGRKSGDDIKDGFRKAEDGVEEFRDEANSTAREAAASFDGSAESIGDAFQEVAANAFAGFGPAGALAGLGVAAGIGLGIKAFEDLQEQQELSEEKIASWAQAFIDAGGRVIGAAQIVAEVQAIATDPERYKQAAQNAKDWGVDESTAMRAIAGDATALEVVRSTLNDRTEEANRLLAEQEQQVDSNAGAAYDLADAVQRGASSFATLTGEMQAGQGRAQAVSDSLIDIVNNAGEVTEEIDGVGNALYTLPDGTQVVIDAETGQAHQNIDAFQGDLDGIAQTKDVTVRVRVDRSEWDNWRPVIKQGYVSTRPVATSSGRFWE